MTIELNLDWLRIAEEVAKEAGAYLRQGLSKSRQINFQDASDVKLQADLDSEHLIRIHLSRETQLPIVGEEEGGDTALLSSNSFFWVVDPLDGTYNYLRNQPQTCVSIGLMRGSDFIGGVIYDFNRDEIYSGSVMNKFEINHEETFPEWSQSINQGCIMTGFPSRMDCSTTELGLFFNKIQSFKKVRMIGSAALALAFVASGKADAYFEKAICIWDIAAGAALVIAAGGSVKIEPSNKNSPFVFNFCAAGRKEWLAELL